MKSIILCNNDVKMLHSHVLDIEMGSRREGMRWDSRKILRDGTKWNGIKEIISEMRGQDPKNKIS